MDEIGSQRHAFDAKILQPCIWYTPRRSPPYEIFRLISHHFVMNIAGAASMAWRSAWRLIWHRVRFLLYFCACSRPSAWLVLFIWKIIPSPAYQSVITALFRAKRSLFIADEQARHFDFNYIIDYSHIYKFHAARNMALLYHRWLRAHRILKYFQLALFILSPHVLELLGVYRDMKSQNAKGQHEDKYLSYAG